MNSGRPIPVKEQAAREGDVGQVVVVAVAFALAAAGHRSGLSEGAGCSIAAPVVQAYKANRKAKRPQAGRHRPEGLGVPIVVGAKGSCRTRHN
jgi:hypothetical protein